MLKRKRPVRIHRGEEGSSNDDDAVNLAGSANTVEYYASMLKNYDKTQLTRKIYAKPTEQLQEWFKSLWYQFCNIMTLDPIDTLTLMPIEAVHSFFH